MLRMCDSGASRCVIFLFVYVDFFCFFVVMMMLMIMMIKMMIKIMMKMMPCAMHHRRWNAFELPVLPLLGVLAGLVMAAWAAGVKQLQRVRLALLRRRCYAVLDVVLVCLLTNTLCIVASYTSPCKPMPPTNQLALVEQQAREHSCTCLSTSPCLYLTCLSTSPCLYLACLSTSPCLYLACAAIHPPPSLAKATVPSLLLCDLL
jgi:hypothetical protein